MAVGPQCALSANDRLYCVSLAWLVLPLTNAQSRKTLDNLNWIRQTCTDGQEYYMNLQAHTSRLA